MTNRGEPGGPVRLRVASLNIFSGRTSRGVAAGPEALAEVARSLDVDVLAAQEVDCGQPRSGGVDQSQVMATGMDATYSRFAATVLGTPGEPGWLPATGEAADATTLEGLAHTAVPGAAFRPDQSHGAFGNEQPPTAPRPGPAYGVSLVSRLKVEQWHELRLAPARGRFPLPVPGGPARLIWLRDEPRVALAATLANGVTVVCTHLSFVPGVNVRQLRRIHRWLGELALPGPVVVLGDLNLPPLPVRRATGWTSLATAATFPAWRPGVQFDHALGVGLPPGVVARGEVLGELPVGDHRAVRVHLDLPDGRFHRIPQSLA